MIKLHKLFLYIVLGNTLYYLYLQLVNAGYFDSHHISVIYRRLLSEKASGNIISSFLSTTASKNVTNVFVLNERDVTVRLLATQRDGSRLFVGTIEPNHAIKMHAKDGQKLLVVDTESEEVYDKLIVRYNASVSKSLTAYSTPHKPRTPLEIAQLLKQDAINKARMAPVHLSYTKLKRIHPSVVILTQKSEYFDLLQVRIRYNLVFTMIRMFNTYILMISRLYIGLCRSVWCLCLRVDRVITTFLWRVWASDRSAGSTRTLTGGAFSSQTVKIRAIISCHSESSMKR